MNKGFIWGMVGLGVGCAVFGGVGGHFISKATNTIQAESGITAEKEYESYMLPDGLKNVSLTKFELNEKYDIVSCSYGCHLLNKETKEFKNLVSDNVNHATNLNENVYLLSSYNYLYVFDALTENVKKMDFGVLSYSISYDFKSDNKGNVWFSYLDKGTSTYHLGMVDKGLNILKFDVNDSSVMSNPEIILTDDYAFVMPRNNTYSSSYKSYCINMKSGDVAILTGVMGYTENEDRFAIKGNKIYFSGYQGSSTVSFNVIDAETSTVTSLQSLQNMVTCKVYGFENYAILTYNQAYSTYAVKYEDDSVIDLGKYAPYELARGLYFSQIVNEDGSTTQAKVHLYKFNDELGEIDEVFSTSVIERPSNFNHFKYAGVDFLSISPSSSSEKIVYKVTYDADGKVTLKLLNLKFDITENMGVFELSNKADIFYGNSKVFYYDLKTDEFVSILNSNGSLLKIEEKDENVYLYKDNGEIYRFGIKDKMLGLVGYFDVEE